MIDNDSLERIALHVLDVPHDNALPNGHDPRYLSEMEELAAELTLAAPRRKAPVRVLGRALVEVGSEMKGGGAFPPSRSYWPWAGAAAAAAALIAAAFFAGRETGGDSPKMTDGRGGEVAPSLGTDPTNEREEGELVDGDWPGIADGDRPNKHSSYKGRVSALPNGTRSWRELKSDRNALRDAVARLRAEREQRLVGAPGLSRTLVVEMDAPGSERPPGSGVEISRMVGEAVAAALLPGDEGSAPLEGGNPDGGAPEEAPQPDDVPAVPDTQELGNPVETRPESTLPENVERLRDGFYWDHTDRELWIRSEVDDVLVRIPVPDGFNYDELEDSPEIDAIEAGTLPAPGVPEALPEFAPEPDPIEAAPPSPEPVIGEGIAEPVSQPFAYSIFHETTGEGSIIVSNLPQVAVGEFYHLWVRDSLDGRILPVGSLPPDIEPTEAIDFPAGLQGVSPAGFLLTLEDSVSVDAPSGNVVLQGPKPPTSTP